LSTSLGDLKAKLDVARRDYEDAAAELGKLEPADDRVMRKTDPRAMVG
jgi:hypothetical protein